MVKMNERIIKAGDINFEGSCCLNISPERTSRQKPSVSVSPEARIIENNSEYAVIGITCSCGSQISLRCDYSGEPAAEHE